MGVIRNISDFIDDKLFGGRVEGSDLLAMHIPSQLAGVLPYRSYDEEQKIFFNEDSVGVVYEMIPLIGIDEKTYNVLNSLLSKSVPSCLNLQILNISSPKIGTVLDVYKDSRRPPNAFYNVMAKHRVRHFEGGVWNSLSRNSNFFLRYHRVVISASILTSENPDAIDELKEFGENVEGALGQISPMFRRYQPVDLIRLVTDVLNPNSRARPSNQSYDASEPINTQIMSPDTAYRVDQRGLVVRTSTIKNEMSSTWPPDFEDKEYGIRTLEAKNFPLHMAFGDMSRCIGDFFSAQTRFISPVMSSLNIYYPPEGDSKAMASLRHMRATNNAASPVAKYMPVMRAKAKDWDYASEAMNTGARIVKVSFQTTVTAPLDLIEKAERNAKNLLTSLNYDMRRSDHIHFPALLYGLPMGAGTSIGRDMRKLGRSKTMPSTMLPVAAPMFGEYMGSNSPVMLKVGRIGQPYLFDNFSNRGEGNHNVRVTAGSGGGKSVWLNELVFGTCANGGRAYIFDDGYSFKNHCLLTGGRHYQFSLNDDFGLNVFGMIDYQRAARDEEYKLTCIEMARCVVSQMIFGEVLPSKEQSAILNEAIVHVMKEHRGEGTIDYVRTYLLTMPSTDLDSNTASMAKSLSSYCSDGVYGKFFNGENTLDLTSHMTVFELSPLEQKPDLRGVILTALLFLVDQYVVSDVSSRDLVIVDEAHKHLDNMNVCDVLQGWARRLRKYNAALCLATQSTSDFKINPLAEAISENCEWKVMLKTDAAGRLSAKQMGTFPDEFSEKCARHMDVSQGEYSEALVIGGGSYNLGRLVMDPFSIAVFTTTAEQVAEINGWVASGYSLEDAIYRVSGVAPLESSSEEETYAMAAE